MKDEERLAGGLAVSLRRRVFSIPTLVSLSVAVALIVSLATRFDVSWGQTWTKIRAVDPSLYALAFCFHYAGFGLRGLRWRILAKKALPAGPTHGRLPSVARFGQLVMIGWFVNSVAWLRMGDAYRAYLLSDRMRGSFSWALGTIVAEHVVDLMVVFSLILVGGALASLGSEFTSSGYVIAAALLMSGGLGLLMAMRQFGPRLARFLPIRFEHAYHQFHGGALGGTGQLPLVYSISTGVWLLEVARFYLVAQSIHLGLAVSLALIVTISHAILSAVPTPGGLGAVEIGLVGLLVLTGLNSSDASSLVVLERSITYLSVIVVGGLLFVLLQFSRAGRAKKAVQADRPAARVESGDAISRGRTWGSE